MVGRYCSTCGICRVKHAHGVVKCVQVSFHFKSVKQESRKCRSSHTTIYIIMLGRKPQITLQNLKMIML